MTTGFFLGRFQPFHLGHLQDIRDALKEVDQLIIGIGSSQHSDTKENPFSTEERIRMIEDSLIEAEISNYTIFPIPDINNHAKYAEHVEVLIPKFDIVFTGSDFTEKLFKEKGYKIKKIKIVEETSSTDIRKKILNNEDWQSLVPKAIVKYLEEIKGIERIKKIYG